MTSIAISVDGDGVSMTRFRAILRWIEVFPTALSMLVVLLWTPIRFRGDWRGKWVLSMLEMVYYGVKRSTLVICFISFSYAIDPSISPSPHYDTWSGHLQPVPTSQTSLRN